MLADEKRRPPRVLVVGDPAVALSLTGWGYEVRTALNGLEALAVSRTFRPDAVLVGLGLPGLDGYEVARQLRQERGPRRFIVAMAASGELDRGRFWAAGFDGLFLQSEGPVVLQRVLMSGWKNWS
jgi:two-component system, chemotaxis family, CheB/CheR fusion protein